VNVHPILEPCAPTSPARSYWDVVAPVYDQLYVDRWSRYEDARVAALLERFTAPGSSVVDLACGTGLGCRLLAATERRFTYTGVDSSAGMLDHFSGTAERVSLVHADALDALEAVPARSVDLVLCLSGSMSFLSDADSVLHRVAKVLRPGGSAVLSFMNRRSVANLVRWRGAREHAYATRHAPRSLGAVDARLFGQPELERMLGAAGLRRWRIDGSSVLAGWCEVPGLWPVDRALANRVSCLTHSLDVAFTVADDVHS
jgi:SAM-dependent methyltransferase